MTKLQFRLMLPEADKANPGYRFAPLLIALEALTRINQWHFRRGAVPPLETTDVIYKEEPPGREDWDDAILVSQRGWGDCEDLAAYLCAQLRELHGVAAECVIKHRYISAGELREEGYPAKHTPSDGVYLVHVLVRTPDGKIHDPSEWLGMRGEYH